MKEYVDSEDVEVCEYMEGVLPLEEIEMCQFCGNYNHPSEFCKRKDVLKYMENHLEIGDNTGELTTVKGNVLYLKYGADISILYYKIVVNAKMLKLDSDIESRTPLLYFWYDEETCKSVLETMSRKDVLNVEKTITTKVEPVYKEGGDGNCDAVCCYTALNVVNIQKLFFPFDIRQSNCWWPIEQVEEYNIQVGDDYISTDIEYKHLLTSEVLQDEVDMTEKEIGQLKL